MLNDSLEPRVVKSVKLKEGSLLTGNETGAVRVGNVIQAEMNENIFGLDFG